MKKQKLNYHAILTIHGLPKMNKKQLNRLFLWLVKKAQELKNKPKDYSSKFSARLMK